MPNRAQPNECERCQRTIPPDVRKLYPKTTRTITVDLPTLLFALSESGLVACELPRNARERHYIPTTLSVGGHKIGEHTPLVITMQELTPPGYRPFN